MISATVTTVKRRAEACGRDPERRERSLVMQGSRRRRRPRRDRVFLVEEGPDEYEGVVAVRDHFGGDGPQDGCRPAAPVARHARNGRLETVQGPVDSPRRVRVRDDDFTFDNRRVHPESRVALPPGARRPRSWRPH